MVEYFRADYSGAPFVLFSRAHLVAIALTLLAIPLMLAYCRWQHHERARCTFRSSLGVFLLLTAAAWQGWYLATGIWSLAYSLPLHVCGMSLFLCAAMLFTMHRTLFEVCYFWGLAGATQALITPDLTIYGFPHFAFIHSFVSHGAIILAVIYMVMVEGYRPHWRSIPKVAAITTCHLAIAGIANALTGGNYLYIARKPPFPTLIDYLGPWPWYIGSLYVLGLCLFVLVYLPFALRDARIPGSGKA